MGFTICGKFLISYKVKSEDTASTFIPNLEYEIYIWRWLDRDRIRFAAKHRIFKSLKDPAELDDVMFLQFPSDPHKLICYGSG